MGPLNISEEMAKTETQNKSILLLSRNIAQSMSEKVGNAIRETYHADKQYLAFHGAKEGRKDSNTFTRRRDGVCSWQIAKRFPLFLINNCIAKDQKSQNKRNSAFLIIKFQFSIPPR